MVGAADYAAGVELGEVAACTGMKTVLLIDDDHGFRKTLGTWLSGAGWEVLEAENGEAGLAAIRQHRPHVVICDLLMPRCNGFRLCRLIHADPQIRDTKIIISSSRGYGGDRINALEVGADEYLVKPVDRAELLKLLDGLLSSPHPAPTTPQPNPSPVLSTVSVEPANHAGQPGLEGQPTRIRFWGVRGSLPTPGPKTVFYGGNTTCVEVRADQQIIILDAGTGIRPLGLSLVQEFKDRPINATLLISHTHWDHIQGFPYFVPAYNPRNHITICGFEGSREGLQTILSSQMESPYFPVSLRQLPSHISIRELQDLRFNIGKVQIEAYFANHPGICVGYRLNTSCGSIAFLPDNEPHQRLRGQSAQKLTQEAVAYARQQDEKLIDFIRDVDLLIIDSQYDDTEYQSHVGWGHGCLDDVVTLALFAGAKQLHLFHHDPDHDDAQITRMVNWARDLVALHGDSLIVEAAREGLEVVLNPVGELATQAG